MRLGGNGLQDLSNEIGGRLGGQRREDGLIETKVARDVADVHICSRHPWGWSGGCVKFGSSVSSSPKHTGCVSSVCFGRLFYRWRTECSELSVNTKMEYAVAALHSRKIDRRLSGHKGGEQRPFGLERVMERKKGNKTQLVWSLLAELWSRSADGRTCLDVRDHWWGCVWLGNSLGNCLRRAFLRTGRRNYRTLAGSDNEATLLRYPTEMTADNIHRQLYCL